MDVYTYKFFDGKVGSLFRDITKQKKTELAIKENEELYKKLFEATEDSFQLLEPIVDKSRKVVDFKYLAVNSAFERQTGFKAEKVIGKRASEVFPEVEHYWVEKLEQVFKSGKAGHIEGYSGTANRWYDPVYVQL